VANPNVWCSTKSKEQASDQDLYFDFELDQHDSVSNRDAGAYHDVDADGR
jgi:hypothetical protein